jgi:hypothetical protein
VGADLTIDGNLTQIVRTAIADGLSKQAFSPIAAGTSTSTSELRVEIRNLDYTMIMGFWAGTLRVDVGLKANCVRGTTRPYEKLFRGEHVESVQVVQSPENNNQYISTAVGDAVSSLLKDQELMRCLAAGVRDSDRASQSTALPVPQQMPAVPSAAVTASPVRLAHPTASAPAAVGPGQDEYNAARLAKDRGCNVSPTPVLVAKGPGFETYSVACTNGDAVAIRCELGNCRTLQ